MEGTPGAGGIDELGMAGYAASTPAVIQPTPANLCPI
jgi:hypothetical protein